MAGFAVCGPDVYPGTFLDGDRRRGRCTPCSCHRLCFCRYGRTGYSYVRYVFCTVDSVLYSWPSVSVAERRVKDPLADWTRTHPLAQEPKRMSLATGQCRSRETDRPLTSGAWRAPPPPAMILWTNNTECRGPIRNPERHRHTTGRPVQRQLIARRTEETAGSEYRRIRTSDILNRPRGHRRRFRPETTSSFRQYSFVSGTRRVYDWSGRGGND